MSSAKVHKIDQFKPGTQPTSHIHEWKKWRETLEVALERANCTNQREMALELTLQIGQKGKELITANDFLKRVGDVPQDFPFYDDLAQKLTDHFKSFSDINIDVANFNSAKQGENEPIVEFHLRLKEAARKIGAVNDSMVKARLIDGMRDRILSEQAYDQQYVIEKIVAVASRREAAEAKRKQNRDWKLGTEMTVAAVSENCGPPQRGNAYRGQRFEPYGKRLRELVESCQNCGLNHGKKEKCGAENAKCHGCSKMGHFKRCCKSMKHINAQEENNEAKVQNKYFY